MKSKFIILGLIILGFISISTLYAEDISIQEQLDIQKQIIEDQNARIEQLEKIIKSLDIKVTDNAINTSDSNNSDTNIANKETEEDQGDIASSSANKIYNPETAFFGPLPQLRSNDGKYSAGVMGLIQLDSAIYDHQPNDSTATELASGFIVRRAVLTMAGVSDKDWIWFLSYNYASGGENPNDGLGAAMAIYRGLKPWWLFVGLFGNSVGLDTSNMSSQRQFMEVAMPQGTFVYGAGSPAMGIAATYRGKQHYMRLGFYGEPFNNASTDDEGVGVHGRLIWQPKKERLKAFHFGFTGYHRLANTSNTFATGTLRDSTLRFRSKGETAVSGDFIVDTGIITDLESYNYSGYEFAMVEGPVSLQSEWGMVNINRNTKDSSTLKGGYIQGGYMLTDDARNYNAYFAQFWRINPKKSIMEGGIGAWELATRASTMDLNDGLIKGGEASSYTLGLNWYMTAFTKSMFNIVKTESSGKISEDFDSINARIQIEF